MRRNRATTTYRFALRIAGAAVFLGAAVCVVVWAMTRVDVSPTDLTTSLRLFDIDLSGPPQVLRSHGERDMHDRRLWFLARIPLADRDRIRSAASAFAGPDSAVDDADVDSRMRDVFNQRNPAWWTPEKWRSADHLRIALRRDWKQRCWFVFSSEGEETLVFINQ